MLRFAYFDDFSPLSFIDLASSSAVGILPDLVSMLLGPLGIAAEHAGYPWARSQELVQDGYADAFCTSPTPRRLQYAVFTDVPVLVTKLAIFYRLDNPRRPQIEAIRGLGDLSYFLRGDYLGNWHPDDPPCLTQPTMAVNIEQVFTMLAAGRIDLFLGQVLVGQQILRLLRLQRTIASFVLDLGKRDFLRALTPSFGV